MRQTPESLMISVMLNTGSPDSIAMLGVRPEHFTSYRDEYEWVTRYFREYGSAPTSEQLRSKFPGFPRVDKDLLDPRQPARELGLDYARKVLMRSMSEAASDIEIDDVESAYKRLSGLTFETFTPPPTNLLASEAFLDDYDKSPPTIKFPWRTPNRVTGGINEGDLVYFAARPTQGKSWCLVKIAAEAAFLGYRVMFYSLEMTQRDLQVRSHAILGNKIGWGDRINAFDMRNKQFDRAEYKQLLGELDEQTEGVLHIHDKQLGRVTPSAVASRAADYDLTIIDYVGLMGTDRGQASSEDWRMAQEISNELKSVALHKETRIIAAAQINRAGDSEGRPIPPKMKDLAGTDAYVQDADKIITMTRIRGGHAAAYSLEKNRGGEDQVRFYTKFLANKGDFGEVSKAEAEDICDEHDD